MILVDWVIELQIDLRIFLRYFVYQKWERSLVTPISFGDWFGWLWNGKFYRISIQGKWAGFLTVLWVEPQTMAPRINSGSHIWEWLPPKGKNTGHHVNTCNKNTLFRCCSVGMKSQFIVKSGLRQINWGWKSNKGNTIQLGCSGHYTVRSSVSEYRTLGWGRCWLCLLTDPAVTSLGEGVTDLEKDYDSVGYCDTKD